jgi:crotonobetainyl-CoA:carnitine CoA-transferase CaiB-like acyl-CoA transferase
VRPREDLPLAGLRILDLTWAWAGPFATTVLADLGAEVINIEWHPRASNIRRNPPYANDREESNNSAGWFSANQRGKLSLGVNLREPDGKQIVRDLAARCDVVVENFSPGVVGRLGIDYDELIQANPRLVYVSLSAFGQTGPNAHYIGYGTQLYAASGASYATGADGQTLSQMWIPYPDPVSGLAGAFAIAAYVYNARVHGRPAFVDVSEMESLCAILLEPLLEPQLEPKLAADAAAPSTTTSAADDAGPGYTVVRTADDHFVALMARDEADRIATGRALDADEAVPSALRAAAERLDASELLERMDQAGLFAVPVQDSSQVLQDPFLNERGFWVSDESPELVEANVRIGGAIWHVDGRRAPIWRGAPPLFSDTRIVLERTLDYEPGRVDDLIERGVIE